MRRVFVKDQGYELWIASLFLCVLGAIMIFSASSFHCMASAKYGFDPYYFLTRQCFYIGLGVAFCFGLQFLNFSIYYKLAKLIYVVSVGMVFLLLTPLGVTVNGATRWLNIAGIQFQVAEVVKIGVIVALSYMIHRYRKSLKDFKLVIYMWLAGGFAAGLLYVISNDLSSSLVVLCIVFGLTFIYTDTVKQHLIVAGVILTAVAAYVLKIWYNLPTAEELEKMSFRVQRIAAWLKPENYTTDGSYQSLQGLYAVGSGGLFGKGLGNSIQKLGALPEAQNDMIFSIFCEELGAMGGLLLFALYLYFFYIIKCVASKANNYFGSALSCGVMLHMAVQSMINLGVNLGVIPNTGITLPFISYGGTAVFCQLVEIGIVLSVERVANEKASLDLLPKRKRHRNRSTTRVNGSRKILQEGKNRVVKTGTDARINVYPNNK